MQNASLWRALLGVEKTVVEDIEFDEHAQVLVAHVRPTRRAASRCGRCQRRSPRYDHGEGRRRWRASDLGTVQVHLEADAPRVNCREHGPTVRAVPWARHAAGHTVVFDERRVAGHPVLQDRGHRTDADRLAHRRGDHHPGLGRRRGAARPVRRAAPDRIDEISYKRGHRYLTVVVDHDSGRLVWAAPGRDKATLELFFDALGEERCQLITRVSADGADWISTVVADRCVNAVRCADPFHVVRWATDALDGVRRQAWNEARGAVTQCRAGRASGHAKALKHARYALWKNPENLTSRQQATLAWVAKTDPRSHRAYLLKEGLRLVFQLPAEEAADALEVWIGWARRYWIPAFVDLQRRIVKHRDSILAAIEHGLSNGRIESVNTKIRLITRVAFGFRSPEALIALAMLNLGGHRPVLPGRK